MLARLSSTWGIVMISTILVASICVLLGYVFFGEAAESERRSNSVHFSSEEHVPLNKQIYSDVVVLRDVQAPVMASVTAGELSVDGGYFSSEPQWVAPGQTLRVRVRSASDFDALTTAVLQAGDVISEFKVRTQKEKYVIKTEKTLVESPAVRTLS